MRERTMSTILLVDTNIEDLQRLGETLKRAGHAVIARAEGFSALTVIRNGPPVDAVITECRLSDMDGIQFLSALKRHAPSLPIIVLSAVDSIEIYLNCLNLGVYEYVKKPVLVRVFEKIVQSALRRQEPEMDDAH
jgi:DNA-binding NtrC family response regulator